MAEEYPDIPLEHMPTGESFQSTAPSIDWLDYYLGPTGIPDRSRSVNELLNPIVALQDISAQSAAAANPDLSPEERRRAALTAGVGTALVALPAGRALFKMLPAFRWVDDDAARAVWDTLTGFSPDLTDPARRQLLAGIGATSVAPLLPSEELFRATPPVREVTEEESSDLGSYLTAVAQGSPDTVLRAGIGDNGGPPLQDPARLSTGLYSPSLRAVQNLPQERGTYQQLRAQILKGGGKEEELRFAGLDRMFAPEDPVTRQQLQDALQRNVDMVGVVENRATGVLGDVYTPAQEGEVFQAFYERNRDDYRDRLLNEILPPRAMEDTTPLREFYEEALRQSQMAPPLEPFSFDPQGYGLRRLEALQESLEARGYASIDDYMADYPEARAYLWRLQGRDEVSLYGSVDDAVEALFDVGDETLGALSEDFYQMTPQEQAEAAGVGFSFDPGDTRYSEYMTPGLVDYRERRYAFTDPGAVLSPGDLRNIPRGHFEEDDIRNFVHTRSALGYTSGSERPDTYVLGEVQSDTAQGLRNWRASEETLEDRAVLAMSSTMPGDITPEDWRQMQRMPDDYLPGLRGNVVEQLSMNPDSPLSLEGYQNAVALAQGDKRSRLMDAVVRLQADLDSRDERLREQFELGLLSQLDYDLMVPILEEQNRRPLRDLENFIQDSDNTYSLLRDPFIPDEARDRIRRGEWLSEEEIQALYSEGERVPAAVGMLQTLAQRGVNPDTYSALVTNGRELNRTTRSAQPYVGSTNRWVDFALKSELVNAANEGVPFFAISNPDMVRRATYGSEEGQGEFYGKIVPQRLRNILRRLDSDIVTTTDAEEASRLRSEGRAVFGPLSLETADQTESVFGLNITPTLRQKILGEEGTGLSSYAKGGIVSLFPNLPQ